MTNEKQATVSDDVVRKIQLLLNLAERAEGNEAEAAAAMAKAQDILARYNLDLATVQDAVVAGGTNKTREEVRREKAEAKRNATYEWTHVLYRAVAEANYCKYWTADVRTESKTGRARWVKRHKVLGRVENTTAVLMMADYLYATVMRLLPYDKSTWLSSDALAWCDGCVERLAERVAAKAEEQRTPNYVKQGEAAYCVALAVRSMAETEAIGNYEAENGPGSWAKKLARDKDYAEKSKLWAAQADERHAKELEAQKQKLLAETPEERKSHEREEAKQARKDDAWRERYWARQDRRDERDLRRRSGDAFRSGSKAGDGIGLDSQLAKGAEPKGRIQ